MLYQSCCEENVIKPNRALSQVLRDIRGVDDVEEEFGDIRAACAKAASITNPWRTICRPAYAPQLFIAITATLFQQWTGVELFRHPCLHA